MARALLLLLLLLPLYGRPAFLFSLSVCLSLPLSLIVERALRKVGWLIVVEVLEETNIWPHWIRSSL
jgi:hypothetical protein